MSLYLLGLFKRKSAKKTHFFPGVTVIITAYNEEERIKEKLHNTLSLECPNKKLQIIVASDGSTDRTNAIVKDYEKNGIELLAKEERLGKENAQKEAVRKAKGEVIIFSDVAAQLDPGGLKEIVFNFADLSVGCVSSKEPRASERGIQGSIFVKEPPFSFPQIDTFWDIASRYRGPGL